MKMISWAAAGVAILFFVLIGGLAIAQQAVEKQKAHETVEVFAPYVVRHAPYTPKRGITRQRLELLSVDRPVSFADLDLTNAADQATLEARVKQAAKDACRELEHRFLKKVYVPIPGNQDCVKAATDEAMIQVNALIVASTAH